MLVVEARHMGMCFGVKDALQTIRELPDPAKVTVRGELVHNPVVVDELEARGFHQQKESQRALLPATEEVLITAHGVSNSERDRLVGLGYTLHDTTCPLVRRAHKAALHYGKKGYFVVVVGKRGHVEVDGLAGDLLNHTVVSHPDEIESYPVEKIAVVNQTTTRPDDLARFHQRLRELNRDTETVFVDTTCQPTRDRQDAVRDLVQRVEALVVVGGPNSNNTLQLGQVASQNGVPWWRVTTAADLQPEWFTGVRIVGLTAGTSTTEETIREVSRALRSIKARKLTA